MLETIVQRAYVAFSMFIKLVPTKMQYVCMKSRTRLSWTCHFLCALFSLLTSAKQCSLLQRCTCLPSVVMNTMKVYSWGLFFLCFFTAYSCASFYKICSWGWTVQNFPACFISSSSVPQCPLLRILGQTFYLPLNFCHWIYMHWKYHVWQFLFALLVSWNILAKERHLLSDAHGYCCRYSACV